MSSSTSTSSSGIGLSGLLGILFVALKLTGYISWSWWWVLLPFYFPVVIGGIFIVLAIVASILSR